MPRMFKRDINFIGNRNVFFVISGLLIVVSLAAVLVFGLNFGIEFSGGTSTSFNNTGDIQTEQIRGAFSDAGDSDAIIQTSSTNGEAGYIVRTSVTDPDTAAEQAEQVAASFGLSTDSFQVTTVGPDWGADVTYRSFLAFIISLVLIIIYMAIRFEYKMGVTAVVALLHDLIIVVGVYALLGREITPNVVAALLTIMGYSLYDTVVVFHRINDNAGSGEPIKTSFFKLANHSINQVFTRTINTTLTSFVPVLCMLFFGGATLEDFAFAMAIGLITGSYSSIGIASPLYALWKGHEPKYAKLNAKYPDDLLPRRVQRKRGIAGIDAAATVSGSEEATK